MANTKLTMLEIPAPEKMWFELPAHVKRVELREVELEDGTKQKYYHIFILRQGKAEEEYVFARMQEYKDLYEQYVAPYGGLPDIEWTIYRKARRDEEGKVVMYKDNVVRDLVFYPADGELPLTKEEEELEI